MEEFKVLNFKGTFPHRDFPWYRSLDREEAKKLRERLSIAFSVSDDISDGELLLKLKNLGEAINGVNAEDEAFNFTALASSVGITLGEMVFVVWSGFCDIDQFRAVDIADYFSDIWYPSADDIEIFDESCEWMIFISHEGYISVASRG